MAVFFYLQQNIVNILAGSVLFRPGPLNVPSYLHFSREYKISKKNFKIQFIYSRSADLRSFHERDFGILGIVSL